MIELLHWELPNSRVCVTIQSQQTGTSRRDALENPFRFGALQLDKNPSQKSAEVIWAHRVRAQTRGVAPASQRSHPKPSLTQQPYKRRRTPPIVRILQYPREFRDCFR